MSSLPNLSSRLLHVAVAASRRASIVYDPANGRVPPLTPEAQPRAQRRAASLEKADNPATWTDMTIRDRCILYRPLPNLPTNNNNFQIVTVEDARTWARPWSGAYTLRQNSGLLYEYACHRATTL